MINSPSEKTNPLSLIKSGSNVRLMSIAGGSSIRSRLVSMGLLQGTTLEVVKNSGRGPVIVSIRGSRLVLGRGMAHKIIVDSIEP